MNPFDAQITFLSVRDLERSSRFYGELLGLPLVLDQGKCRIFRAGRDAYLGVCVRDDAPRPEGVVFTLVTEDVDAWQERLASEDVPIEKPAAENPEYRIYNLFARDPDGYLVEIQRFLDPRWAEGRPEG
jgi:catechol 2,3-dioxygenase-like lactoylglutathione lyase family enzyme